MAKGSVVSSFGSHLDWSRGSSCCGSSVSCLRGGLGRGATCSELSRRFGDLFFHQWSCMFQGRGLGPTLTLDPRRESSPEPDLVLNPFQNPYRCRNGGRT